MADGIGGVNGRPGVDAPGLVFVILVFYYLVAAASVNGVYTKWGLRDEPTRLGFVAMIEGTADKPFVFRQLVPRTVNAIDRALPGTVRVKAIHFLTTGKDPYQQWETSQEFITGIAGNPRYAVRYYLTYVICFGAMLGAMGLIHALCRAAGFSRIAAIFTPVCFAIALPLFETVGGYFYDFTEIAFIFAFLDVFLYRRFLWLAVPLAVLGTDNKESFLFFMALAAPLLIRDRRDVAGIVSLLACLAAGAAVHYAGMVEFRANHGSNTEFQLGNNLRYYLDPRHLLTTEVIYRMRMFRAYSLMTLLALAAMIRFALPRFSPRMWRYALLTFVVNAVLLLLFAAPGEMRNFSLSYPLLVLLIAATIDYFTTAGKPVPGMVARI